ncbi:MAG: SDR family oxidoreductase, partial [Candidatus Riflebacteria bacterium]|nr:SDR family oxidoreductase [Candidatus Riflebacteria bacterium]
AEILETNVVGTRRLLEGLIACGVSRLYHISTAFVCGQSSGEILERVVDPQKTQFNNLYEESKARAESLLLAQSDLPVDVLRPSIIVGSTVTGWAHNFTGYYTLYNVLRAALQEVRSAFAGRTLDYLPIRLPGVPCACTDVVPVDYVASVTARLVESDAAGTVPPSVTHRIFHVVGRVRRTTAFFLDAAQAHLGFSGARFVPPSLISDPHPLERWCASRLRFNNAYTVRDYRFRDDAVRLALGDRMPAGPEVDAAALGRINRVVEQHLAASTQAPARDSQRPAGLAERLAADPEFVRRNGIDPRRTGWTGATVPGTLPPVDLDPILW